MAEDARDMLIMLLGPKGPLPGECLAVYSDGDDLMKGFSPKHYADVQSFEFSAGLTDDSDGKSAAGGGKPIDPKHPPKGVRYIDKTGQFVDEKTGKPVSATGATGTFSRFTAGGQSAIGSRPYLADLQKVSFTKLFDVMSLQLFRLCSQQATLNSATLVKRKASGQRDSRDGVVELRGYLRFDFKEVLITDIDWTEDRVIKETCKFICREAKVQYCMEDFDGTLRKMAEGKWSVKGNPK